MTKYTDDAARIMRLLREKFAEDDARERARWGKGYSDQFGYSRSEIAEWAGLSQRRCDAVLRALLKAGQIRVASTTRIPSSVRRGVAGGGAGNFRPRAVSSEYTDTRYRAIDATKETQVESLGVAVSRTTLYHGTRWENLAGVLATGLRPRAESHGGTSPHRTKTTSAVFLTDSLEGAMLYASTGSEDPVILEIDVTGLDLHPDYDDTSDIISTDLSNLDAETGGDWHVGDEIPEDEVDAVEDGIERISEDRETPTTLEVVHVGETSYLYAKPFVKIAIVETHARELHELYEWHGGLVWDEGTPYLLIQQYLCNCSIGPERIVRVLVPAARSGGKGTRQTITDLSLYTAPEGEDVDDLIERGEPDAIEFRKREMAALALSEARGLAGPSGKSQPSDPVFRDEGQVGERWGSKASGVLFVTPDGHVLLLERSHEVLDPGTWSVPGGAIPRDAAGRPLDTLESALNEAREETGWSGIVKATKARGYYVWRAPDSGFTYTTFVVETPRFKPRLNWEHTDAVWLKPQEINEAEGLHPAFLEAWEEGLRTLVVGIDEPLRRVPRIVDPDMLVSPAGTPAHRAHNKAILSTFLARQQKLKGGLGDTLDPRTVRLSQLAAGQRVEMEHTTCPYTALEITLDHLAESPTYYSKLAKVHLD